MIFDKMLTSIEFSEGYMDRHIFYYVFEYFHNKKWEKEKDPE